MSLGMPRVSSGSLSGAGSMKGCLFASLLIGVVDTLARAYLSAVGDAGRALANMVVYVCSPQASATTGAALRVDGGVLNTI